MIREFLFRAYLVAFAGSVVLTLGLDMGVGKALGVAFFWLIVGWICQPLFKKT